MGVAGKLPINMHVPFGTLQKIDFPVRIVLGLALAFPDSFIVAFDSQSSKTAIENSDF